MSDPVNTIHSDVVVIGGGPAGSTSAAALAERGHSVLLLERARFPRFHIGESMLTYTAGLLDQLGLGDAVRGTDFPIKTGAEFSSGDGAYTRVDFTDQGEGRALSTYQVERSHFDTLLMDHAVDRGVRVEYEARVTAVETDGPRITGVTYVRDGRLHRVRTRLVVDASGRTGVIAKGHLRSRRIAPRLRMVAVFRHFEEVDEATNPGVEGDIQISGHLDGWVWAIPIRPGKLSVGTVMRPESLQGGRPPADVFADHLARAPRISQRVEGARAGELRTETDFSYYSEQVAGPGFLLAGDAGCFVDPIFSAGVYLAMTTGRKAGELGADVLESRLSEERAAELYSSFYKTGYDCYFRLIYAFYEHDFKLGRFLKSTGVRVDPHWVALLLGGDFWSAKNPLARHLRGVAEYRTFDDFEPWHGCPVYPDIEAGELAEVPLGVAVSRT